MSFKTGKPDPNPQTLTTARLTSLQLLLESSSFNPLFLYFEYVLISIPYKQGSPEFSLRPLCVTMTWIFDPFSSFLKLLTTIWKVSAILQDNKYLKT